MSENKNALAKLATNLLDAMTAIAETGLTEDRHVDTINRAQRIVAELAKADIGEIHMAATLPKDGRQILSCIDEAVWNATDIVDTCRAIAEEVDNVK